MNIKALLELGQSVWLDHILCPDVLANTFGPQAGYPELRVLDSTEPAQIATFEAMLDLPHTLLIVSSKSGTTLEPNVLADHFYARVRTLAGDRAGEQLVVITDPDRAHLQEIAAERRYWTVFFGEPGIGGRYSALSHFGLVPAAAMGLDVAAFLDRTAEMVHACAACVPAHDNPGVRLGAVLGTLALAGRDKLTLVASPRLVHLGAWIEQLLAESTGKQGRGLIPVDRELLGPPEVYGEDRLFVYLRFDPEPGDEAAKLEARRLTDDTGVFLQITCDSAHDVPVEGARYTFGVVEAAQARGDLAVLDQRHRRALRVHLGSDVDLGLRALATAVTDALV